MGRHHDAAYARIVRKDQWPGWRTSRLTSVALEDVPHCLDVRRLSVDRLAKRTLERLRSVGPQEFEQLTRGAPQRLSALGTCVCRRCRRRGAKKR